jgi:hypothetical protein
MLSNYTVCFYKLYEFKAKFLVNLYWLSNVKERNIKYLEPVFSK